MAMNRDDEVIRDFARHRVELCRAVRAQAYFQIVMMTIGIISVGVITGLFG